MTVDLSYLVQLPNLTRYLIPFCKSRKILFVNMSYSIKKAFLLPKPSLTTPSTAYLHFIRQIFEIMRKTLIFIKMSDVKAIFVVDAVNFLRMELKTEQFF